MQDIAEEIKRTVFKITRVGEHVGREVARRMAIPFGIVDISLAPTSLPGDSVAEILEIIGVERVGLPGTTVALAMLNDAVKKGGAMATSRAGGLSGAFIPVSEDANFASAAADGHLVLEKMEALTAVCSVGLDIIGAARATPAPRPSRPSSLTKRPSASSTPRRPRVAWSRCRAPCPASGSIGAASWVELQ